MFSTTRLAKALTECLNAKLTMEEESPLENPDKLETATERDLIDAFHKLQNTWKLIMGGTLSPLQSSHAFHEPKKYSEKEPGLDSQTVSDDDDHMDVDDDMKTERTKSKKKEDLSRNVLEDFISTSQQLLYFCSQFEVEYSALVEREIVGTTDLLSVIQTELNEDLCSLSEDLPHFIPTEAERDLIKAIQMLFYHDKSFHEYYKISSVSLLTATGALGISPRLVGSGQSYALFEGLLLRMPLENLISVHDDEIEADGDQYNLNAKGLIIYKDHKNIYQAISTIVMGNEKGAELLQLSLYHRMMTDIQISEFCQKNEISERDLRLNILSSSDFAKPSTLTYVSQIIGKSIVLHIGSFEPSTLSYRFGEPTTQEINILELDHKYYSLVTQTFQKYNPCTAVEPNLTGTLLPENRLSVPYPINNSFGEFSDDMKVYYEKCSFCVDYMVPECHHLSQQHVDATKRITLTLQNHCYGNRNANNVLHSDLDNDTTNELPQDLKKDFVVVKTPGMNDCLFNSISYSISGSFDMALPLRRGVATEIKCMESFYINCYEDMGYTKDEISKFLKDAYSFDSWGNLDTANALSKVIMRKIIIYRIPDPKDNPGTQYGHTTLNLGSYASKTYVPVYVLLKHDHFSSLIPRNCDDAKILKGPEGKDKLFVFMQKTLTAMILDLPHNYSNSQPVATQQPFILSITPGVFDELILEKIHIRDSGWTVTQTEDYKLFANIILPELIYIKNMAPLEDYINTFVHRTTFDSFWREGIVKAKTWYGDSRGRLKLKNKAKTLLWIQENDLGRQCTTALMVELGFSDEAVNMYESGSNAVFQYLSCKRRSTGKNQKTLDSAASCNSKVIRKKPEYTQAGTQNAKLYQDQVLQQQNIVDRDIQNHETINEGDEIIEIQTDYSMYEVSIVDWGTDNEEIEDDESYEEIVDNEEYFEDNIAISKKILHSFVNTYKPDNQEQLQYRDKTETNDDCDDDVFVVFYTYACESYASDFNTAHHQSYIDNDKDENVSLEYTGLTRSPNPVNTISLEERIEQHDLGKDTCVASYPITVDDDDDEGHDSLSDDREIVQQITAIAKGIRIPEDVLQYQPPTDFEFTIPHDDVNVMYDFGDNRFRKGAWPIVVDKFLQREHKACSFNATRGVALLKKQSSPYARLYGKCRCNIQFTIDIWRKPAPGESLQCNVTTKGSFNLLQAKKSGRQIRNVARQTMSSVLLHNKPGKVYLQNVHKTSIIRLLHQNNQQQSLDTLQRIRHEALNATANHQDPFEDLLSFAKETEVMEQLGTKIKGFVHMRQFDPQNVQLHLYTQASLDMLNTIKQTRSTIIHFDSTGSVTHSINSKRLLYYLAIVASPEGYNFPLAATLSHRGRSFEISDLFKKITTDMQTLHPSFKCLAPIVVCDFSLAVINGLLSGINTMEIMDYLKASYSAMTDNQPFSERKSLVFICTSHVMKSFTHLMKKHIPNTKENKSIRRLCGHAFARLQQATDMHSYVAAIKLISETFGVEYLPREKIAQNKELIECKDYHESNADKPDEEFEDMDMFLDDEPTRKQSPFAKIFRQTRKKVEDENSHDPVEDYKNPFFFPKVVDLISDYYSPYAPMWTSMLLYKTGRHTHGSITNGVVENEFNFLKHNFHDEGACKVNIFVRRQYEYFSGKVKSKLSAPTRTQKRPYKRKQEESPSVQQISTQDEVTSQENNNDKTAEEVWIKRPKKNLPLYISSHPLPKNDQEVNQQCATEDEDIEIIVENLYNNVIPNVNISQNENEDDTDFPIDVDLEDNNEHTTSCCLENTPSIEGEPILEQIDILKSYRMELMALAEIAVAKRKDKNIVLTSEHIIELSKPKLWFEVDTMDVCLNTLKNKFPQSSFAVMPASFCSKFYNAQTNKNEWRNTRRSTSTTQHVLFDEFYDIDFTNEKHILHPLLVINHWVLLNLDMTKQICTIYDSLYKTANLRSDIRKNALPVFIKDQKEIKKWTCKFSNKSAEQKDGSSCALHVIATAKVLLSGEDSSIQKYENIDKPEEFRFQLIRELLRSTPQGNRMIEKSGNCNETLKHEVEIFREKLENKKKETECSILKLLSEMKTNSSDKATTTTTKKDARDDSLNKDELSYNRNLLKQMDLLLDGDPLENLKKEIYSSHDTYIKRLTLDQLTNITYQIVPTLQQIFTGDVKSTRHDHFFDPGFNKERLRNISLGPPFTQSQDRTVVDIINTNILPTLPEIIGKKHVSLYGTLVLFPEALIRIFSKVNKVSLEQADEELRLHCGSANFSVARVRH